MRDFQLGKELLGWTWVLGVSLLLGVAESEAQAALDPNQIFQAKSHKTEQYIREGLFTGGDASVNAVVVKNIRRAANSKYERFVIDLEGTSQGEAASLEKPPYYQVAIEPNQTRLVFTIFGSPKLDFNAKKVSAALKKGRWIRSFELYPSMEEHSWTFSLDLGPLREVEVFQLANPTRIILDVRPLSRARAASAPSEE